MGSTKRAILCPNCGKLISADAEKCIHCGMKNPGRFGLATWIQKIFRGNISIVQVIIYFCVGLYVITLLYDPKAIFRFGNFVTFLSPSNKSLWFFGMTGARAIAYDHWWTLITAIYLHGGLLHIFFNMVWFRQVGTMVDELFGTARLILIFTLSGILGNLLSNSLLGSPTIGASGSIFGLFGALIFYGQSRGGKFGEIIFRQTLGWAVVLFLFGFFYPGINNLAHLGGFIGGYISAYFFKYQEQRQENYWHRMFAVFIIVLTIFAFVLVFVFPTPATIR
jgi:rhomboid protease GluP